MHEWALAILGELMHGFALGGGCSGGVCDKLRYNDTSAYHGSAAVHEYE